MSGGQAGFQERFNVSRETMEKLSAYESLLRKWNKSINLVAPGTISQMWDRHFADSAQLLAMTEKNPVSWTDLGSGGGFPGAVIAVLAGKARPELAVTLIESDQRKAAFLRAVSRETEVPFTVINSRIEEAEPQNSRVVSARALAPLDQLLGYVQRHMGQEGIALLSKGSGAVSEVEQARKTWSFTLESTPSMTDSSAAVLKIGEIARV